LFTITINSNFNKESIVTMDDFDYRNVRMAGTGQRYQGHFLDSLITFFLFGCMLYFSKVFELEGSVAGVPIFFIPFLYYALSDALPGGQSLGNKVLNISVVSKTTGEPCKVWQSFVRNAFMPILGIIDIILIFGKKHQRLGDKLANTIVVKNG